MLNAVLIPAGTDKVCENTGFAANALVLRKTPPVVVVPTTATRMLFELLGSITRSVVSTLPVAGLSGLLSVVTTSFWKDTDAADAVAFVER